LIFYPCPKKDFLSHISYPKKIPKFHFSIFPSCPNNKYEKTRNPHFLSHIPYPKNIPKFHFSILPTCPINNKNENLGYITF